MPGCPNSVLELKYSGCNGCRGARSRSSRAACCAVSAVDVAPSAMALSLAAGSPNALRSRRRSVRPDASRGCPRTGSQVQRRDPALLRGQGFTVAPCINRDGMSPSTATRPPPHRTVPVESIRDPALVCSVGARPRKPNLGTGRRRPSARRAQHRLQRRRGGAAADQPRSGRPHRLGWLGHQRVRPRSCRSAPGVGQDRRPLRPPTDAARRCGALRRGHARQRTRDDLHDPGTRTRRAGRRDRTVHAGLTLGGQYDLRRGAPGLGDRDVERDR